MRKFASSTQFLCSRHFHLLLPYSRMIKEVQTISFFHCFSPFWLSSVARLCMFGVADGAEEVLTPSRLYVSYWSRRASDGKVFELFSPSSSALLLMLHGWKVLWRLSNCQFTRLERKMAQMSHKRENVRLQQVNLRWKFNFSSAFIIFGEAVMSMSDVAMRFISRVVCCCFRRIDFRNIFLFQARLKKTFFVVLLECFSGGCRWNIETFDKSKISARLNFHEQKYKKLNCLHSRIECFRARVELWTFFLLFFRTFTIPFRALELSSRAKQFPFDCWNQQHAIHMAMKSRMTYWSEASGKLWKLHYRDLSGCFEILIEMVGWMAGKSVDSFLFHIHTEMTDVDAACNSISSHRRLVFFSCVPDWKFCWIFHVDLWHGIERVTVCARLHCANQIITSLLQHNIEQRVQHPKNRFSDLQFSIFPTFAAISHRQFQSNKFQWKWKAWKMELREICMYTLELTPLYGWI